MSQPLLPSEFLWRRLHSLTGLFLVLFLCEHLFTNSQATWFLGDDGKGFIRAVDMIHNLPYLPVIELVLLATPFLIHILWGIVYAWNSSPNSFLRRDGRTPRLPYAANRAYSWQRITAWLLLFGIVAHVVQMRYLHAPEELQRANYTTEYAVSVYRDGGLPSISERLHSTMDSSPDFLTVDEEKALPGSFFGDPSKSVVLTPSFGTAELLIIRDLFRSPWMVGAYVLFVLCAAFHACNGLWTFCITWGITLHPTAQRIMRRFSTLLMAILLFLGWSATAVYWLNLKN